VDRRTWRKVRKSDISRGDVPIQSSSIFLTCCEQQTIVVNNPLKKTVLRLSSAETILLIFLYLSTSTAAFCEKFEDKTFRHVTWKYRVRQYFDVLWAADNSNKQSVWNNSSDTFQRWNNQADTRFRFDDVERRTWRKVRKTNISPGDVPIQIFSIFWRVVSNSQS